MKTWQLLLVIPLLAHAAVAAEPLTVTSPDGRLELAFSGEADGQWTYSFRADGRALLNASPLGLVGVGKPALADTASRSVNTVWKPVWGKRAVVPDKFHELTLDLKSYRLVARAYDDGVAFRYETPAGKATGELTQFNFAGDYTAWFYNGEHHNLGPERLSDSDGRRLPVMTIKVDDSCYLAIHEADLPSGDPLVL